MQRNTRARLTGLLMTLSVAMPQSGLPQTDTLQILDNNVSGGGFQSDVSITKDGQTVYSSADISGVFKSTDGGLLFEKRSRGLRSLKIASLAITADNDQIIYVGTGDKGGSGGLFRSTDGGDTWMLTDAGIEAQFAGNHTSKSDPLPKGHPRSNGDLIVIAEGNQPAEHADDIVIAGTYKNGVMFFAQGGDRLVSTANPSGYVRSLAGHTDLPDTVYAAIHFSDRSKNGIYKIDYRNINAPVSTKVFSTPAPEGLAVLSNGHVYGAIGAAGVVRFDGKSWTEINNGLTIGNDFRQWTAVAGYVTGDGEVVYAGSTNMGGNKSGGKYSNIWRTENGGRNWQALVDADRNVSDEIHGKSYEWWFRTRAFSNAGLGRSNSVVSAIAVSQGRRAEDVADDIVFVSGRGGLWKSENGGRSWMPAVYNMQATSNNTIAVNPKNPDYIAVANTDYTVIATAAGFTGDSIARVKPQGAASKGFDLVFDSTNTELILGVGNRDTNSPGDGEVYVQSAVEAGNLPKRSWTNTQLGAVTAPANGRVRAVSYGYHDGANTTSRIILAAVEGDGVYRLHKGKWSKSAGAKIGSTEGSRFVWPANDRSGVVYLLDLSAGLLRSTDGGQNWMNFWPAMQFRNSDFYNSGYITADDSDPTMLFVSIQGDKDSSVTKGFKVLRLTNADKKVFNTLDDPDISDITQHAKGSQIKRPGPLVFGPGKKLWLTEQQDVRRNVYAGLYVMENPATDRAFKDLTTEDYQFAVPTPSGIAVSNDGHLYISQNGNGIVKIALPCRYWSGC